MRTLYDPGLKATVTFDDAGRVRGINHFDEYREMENLRGRGAAAAYVRDIAGNLNVTPEALRSLEQPVSYLDPRQQDVEYRFSEEKVSFDSATYVYYQTYLNTPVWAAGITAALKQAPARVVGATDTSEHGIDAKLPSPEAMDRYRRLFATGEKTDGPPSRRKARRPQESDIAGSNLLTDILGDAAKASRGLDDAQTTPRLIRGRFFVYRYDAKERTQEESHHVGQPICGTPPTLPLPAVPKSIQDGSWYLVAELVFRLPYEGARMNWRMLVEVETNTIVYLRALSSGVVMGKVFTYDPITITGTKTNTPDKCNAVLNPHRKDKELRNLNPPAGMPLTQSLEGTWAAVTNITPPDFLPPTRPAGSNFDIWDVRTNEFAAVNAYYHTDRFFRLVADLGFLPLTGAGGYFGATEFPIEVDHRGCRSFEDQLCLDRQGNIVNAGLIGHGDSIDYVYYALAHTRDVVNPIGIATDWRVTLHELGGHGILWPHVGEGQFKFAHSAGDSFAMILTDYLSEWHNGAALDRFLLLPFVPTVVRRSNRGVAEWSVAKVTVTNGGSGYLTVSLTGGGGGGAKAVVRPEHIVDGAVTKVTVTEPGTGYTSAPLVTISGGGGTGAAATAEIGTSGSVAKVTVTNGGSGYPSPLTVSLMGGGGSGAKAVIRPEHIVGGAVTKVTVTEPGTGYTSAPLVTIRGGGTGAAATAEIGTSGSVAKVTVTNGGSGYTSPLTVSLMGGGGATALVKPEHIVDGAVTKVTVSEPGTGFTIAPSVAFSGGGGTGAAATAEIGTWGWGAGMDQGTDGKLGSGYLSEQILSTTMFRAYQSIGGDATSVNRREFAARCMAYLMLQAVHKLSPCSNPKTPADFLTALLKADADNWTSEGVFGGAYGKVLTWAFEKQNLNNGAPPNVDVYIDDDRAGEYQYLPVHWATTTIWNRRHPDGLGAHEEPALGATNYAYVKIKNRGTSVASDVIVKGYHCKPSAGLLWPNDLQPFTTPELSAGTLQPGHAEEKTVGPFEWTPVANAWGHDCMLMIVSAPGDPSNVGKFTTGEVIEDWRLVPNDNNVAQRNVVLLPGGDGLRGLMAALHGKGLWVGNPGRISATIAVSVALPSLLAQRGWRIGLRDLPADGARMKPREQRLVTFDVHTGAPFTKADAEAATERDIVVTVTANDAIIGGMVYRIDPELDMPFNERTSAS